MSDSSQDVQRDLLEAVLDTLIPRSEDGRMPGCGELGVADFVTARVESSPAGTGTLASILDAIEAAAQAARGPFLKCTGDERGAAVAAVAAEHGDLFEILWQSTLVAYYQHPRICRELGLRSGPPYPEGYELGDSDLSLLDPVRGKPPFYRRPA